MRILIKPIACLYFLFSCLGCDRLYRFLDKEGAQEKELIGQALPYEHNPAVEEIQRLLKIYGYYSGLPDGAIGAKTRGAIIRFQQENGLKETRYVDDATWSKLKVFRENQLIVKGNLNIKLVQKLLKKAGFNPGSIDGSVGKNTIIAVKQFQKVHGLMADGKIGYKTLEQLSFYLSETKAPSVNR